MDLVGVGVQAPGWERHEVDLVGVGYLEEDLEGDLEEDPEDQHCVRDGDRDRWGRDDAAHGDHQRHSKRQGSVPVDDVLICDVVAGSGRTVAWARGHSHHRTGRHGTERQRVCQRHCRRGRHRDRRKDLVRGTRHSCERDVLCVVRDVVPCFG